MIDGEIPGKDGKNERTRQMDSPAGSSGPGPGLHSGLPADALTAGGPERRMRNEKKRPA